MAITLTENAATQIRKPARKRGRRGTASGWAKVGCSGLAYTFDYADELHAGDRMFEAHNAKVVVDAETLLVLDGSRLDFVRDGFEQVFKFDNPNVEATFGCGESFNVKGTVKA